MFNIIYFFGQNQNTKSLVCDSFIDDIKGVPGYNLTFAYVVEAISVK